MEKKIPNGMYVKVFTVGDGHFIYVNPNCNMKLIYEYIRVAINLSEEYEIDLCSETGSLLGIYDAECSSSGLSYLKPMASYYIFIFDYVKSTGMVYDPRPLMDPFNSDFEYVFTKIKQFFGIPKSENIDAEDAALIFEHLTISHDESTLASANVSFITGRKKSSRNTRKSDVSNNILQQWRNQKKYRYLSEDLSNNINRLTYQSGLKHSPKKQHDEFFPVEIYPKGIKSTENKYSKNPFSKSDLNSQFPPKVDDILSKSPPVGNMTLESSQNLTSSTSDLQLSNTSLHKSIRQFFSSQSKTLDPPKLALMKQTQKIEKLPDRLFTKNKRTKRQLIKQHHLKFRRCKITTDQFDDL